MLTLTNISKTFNAGTVNEKKALDNISLHLPEGDFVTIVGSNGAGKSTLFGAIAGSFYVDEGTVTLEGRTSPLLRSISGAIRLDACFRTPEGDGSQYDHRGESGHRLFAAIPFPGLHFSAVSANRNGRCSVRCSLI